MHQNETDSSLKRIESPTDTKRKISKAGFNFTKLFKQSFYVHRSQKCKKDSQIISHFALFGSICVKAAHKYVSEINPRFQFMSSFFVQKPFVKLYSLGFVIFWQMNIDAKAARKMLVKLTTELRSCNQQHGRLLQ